MQASCCFAKAILTKIVQFLSLQVKHRTRVIRLSRRKVERITQSRVYCQARCRFKVVLNKVFQTVSARTQYALLDIDRKRLHLAKKKAGEGVTRKTCQSRTNSGNRL